MAHVEIIPEDRDIARTIDLLGGPGVIKVRVRTPIEAHDLLLSGLPSASLFHLGEQIGLEAQKLVEALGMSLRTLQRRRGDKDKALSPEQSGRTWRLAEVLGRATEIFGTREEALEWLQRPAMALDQRRPIDLLGTPAGAELVEDHLTRLEYGVYA
jgi:putative toxin-antitoxin system antitoxin component (TIGR02293 family)